MGRKIWNILPYDKNQASLLALKCQVDDLAVLLLQSRGIKTQEQIIQFLSSQDTMLSSPYLLKDMQKAVDRIRAAIDNGERILVFGDYDADGVTATALLVSYLEAVGADVTCQIPSRLHEGYGLSLETAKRIADMGINLVITVDNGISSFEEADYFASKSIDFIVTDHHTVGDSLPNAYAVINPHRSDDNSPEENLAGVGVALKLVCALEDGDYDSVLDDYGDLVAIGTIADIVPLVGENRVIVSRGIKAINNSYRPGIIALSQKATLSESITATDIAFGIAPRINAAGRMNSAENALRLLLTEDFEEAKELADKISDDNLSRQKVETEIIEQIEEYFDKNPLYRLDRVLVAYGNNWHPGVIGIAASRLTEKYGRPAIVISVDENGNARGSCRSIDGMSLYEALANCADLLIQFGGHTLAAGFAIKEENIPDFRKKINEYAKTLPAFFPKLNIDLRLNPKGLCNEVLDSLELLEPYGAGNPAPYFGIFDLKIETIKSIGNDKHIKINFIKDDTRFSAVYFGQPIATFAYKEGDFVDIACRINKNEYRGDISLSIQIKDIRPAKEDDIAMFNSLYLYECFLRNEDLSAVDKEKLCPDRKLMADVYRYIQHEGSWDFSAEILTMKLKCDYNKTGAIKICLDVLEKVGILKKTNEKYMIQNINGKADLANCSILKKLGYK